MKRSSILCAVVMLLLGSAARSQEMNEVRVGAADKSAARQAAHVFRKAQPANTARGTASRGREGLLTLRSSPAGASAALHRPGVYAIPAI